MKRAPRDDGNKWTSPIKEASPLSRPFPRRAPVFEGTRASAEGDPLMARRACEPRFLLCLRLPDPKAARDPAPSPKPTHKDEDTTRVCIIRARSAAARSAERAAFPAAFSLGALELSDGAARDRRDKIRGGRALVTICSDTYGRLVELVTAGKLPRRGLQKT